MLILAATKSLSNEQLPGDAYSSRRAMRVCYCIDITISLRSGRAAHHPEHRDIGLATLAVKICCQLILGFLATPRVTLTYRVVFDCYNH